MPNTPPSPKCSFCGNSHMEHFGQCRLSAEVQGVHLAVQVHFYKCWDCLSVCQVHEQPEGNSLSLRTYAVGYDGTQSAKSG